MVHSPIRRSDPRSARTQLLAATQAACEAALATIADYEQLISEKQADTAKLISIRLQLAQNRLAHGAIVSLVAQYLRERNPCAESTIRNLQPEHAGLLHRTSAHTQRWTLTAVENDWQRYCSETREMLVSWTQRVTVEGAVLRTILEEN